MATSGAGPDTTLTVRTHLPEGGEGLVTPALRAAVCNLSLCVHAPDMNCKVACTALYNTTVGTFLLFTHFNLANDIHPNLHNFT